jgi:hypothetical protein
MGKRNCDWEGCGRKANFALYQLLPDFTKRWVYICDKHDIKIANENQRLIGLYPDTKWKEIN